MLRIDAAKSSLGLSFNKYPCTPAFIARSKYPGRANVVKIITLHADFSFFNVSATSNPL